MNQKDACNTKSNGTLSYAYLNIENTIKAINFPEKLTLLSALTIDNEKYKHWQ